MAEQRERVEDVFFKQKGMYWLALVKLLWPGHVNRQESRRHAALQTSNDSVDTFSRSVMYGVCGVGPWLEACPGFEKRGFLHGPG